MDEEEVKNMKALRKSRSLAEAMQKGISAKAKDEAAKAALAEEGTNTKSKIVEKKHKINPKVKRLREFNNQWSIQPYEGLEEIINKKLLPSMDKNAIMRRPSLREPAILNENSEVYDDKLKGALPKVSSSDLQNKNPPPASIQGPRAINDVQLNENDEKVDKIGQVVNRKKVAQSGAAPKKSMLNFKQEARKKMSLTDLGMEHQAEPHEEFGFSLRSKPAHRGTKPELNTRQRIQ